MSLAENLLNELGNETYEVTKSEAEPHIVIGKDRNITVPSQLSRIAIENDKDIQTVTFDMPRYWDGIDMRGFAIYINYRLPNGTLGTYLPLDVVADPIDDTILHFDWTIHSYMTQVSGSISFLITARKADDTGKLKYQWSSALSSGLSVGEGMDIGTVAPDDTADDILTQILNMVQISESDLNAVLNGVMPIEGVEPDEPIIPPEEPDEPVEPEIGYINVVVSAVNSAVATATYIDGQGAQQTAQVGINTILQVKKGSTISFSGTEIVSCDSTISPADYTNTNSIIFVVPETQMSDIIIVFDSISGGQYSPNSHQVYITYGSARISTNKQVEVMVNNSLALVVKPSEYSTIFSTQSYNIEVPHNASLRFISTPSNAKYASAKLHLGGDQSGEILADFKDNQLDYTVNNVDASLQFHISMIQEAN